MSYKVNICRKSIKTNNYDNFLKLTTADHLDFEPTANKSNLIMDEKTQVIDLYCYCTYTGLLLLICWN
jgi:hypothetical protein